MSGWSPTDEVLYGAVWWDGQLAGAGGKLDALKDNGLEEFTFEARGIPPAGSGAPAKDITFFYPTFRQLIRDPVWFVIRLLLIIPVNVASIAAQLARNAFRTGRDNAAQKGGWLDLGTGTLRWWEQVLKFNSELWPNPPWGGIPAGMIVELGCFSDGILVNSTAGRLFVRSPWNPVLFVVLTYMASSAAVSQPLAVPLSFIDHCEQHGRPTVGFGRSSRAIAWGRDPGAPKTADQPDRAPAQDPYAPPRR